MDIDTKITNGSSLEQAEWIILLAFLLHSDYIKASNTWQEFEDEISHRNRYFPNDTHIRKAIEYFANEAVCILPVDKIIFRARVMTKLQSELPEYTRETLNALKVIFPFDGHFTKNYNIDFSRFLNSLHTNLENKEFMKYIKDTDEKLLDRIKQNIFWGYSALDSDAPPCDIVGAGRANPIGVSYLYAAENEHTAIVESRPIIGQIVSVAEIEIKKELKLFDFCMNFNDNNETRIQEKDIVNVISERFSTPNYFGEQGYYSTQYISEMLKTQFCFDGIRFHSSLHKGGINIILFNEEINTDEITKKYIIKNSSLHIINDITVDQKRVLPIS